MITPFHAKYYAHELVRQRSSGDDERLSTSLFNSSLIINPHQIDAALFAFKSPLSKGVILADEVGLGKTIEAGLVMCQLWAERKRKQIVICPASLRKQWSLELQEKFNLKSIILENKTYKEQIKKGQINPFDQNDIVIVSYHFASRMSREISIINWDLVIIDEAHKLRNSYKSSNKLGQGIKLATKDKKKLLLTATPLQNNLNELFGLATIIDEHIFGDIKTFRENYIVNNDFGELRERLSHFCKRTLRKDVLEYIKYTERYPISKEFISSDVEQLLYEQVSDFLQRDDSYAIPYRQKHITLLVIRKVLASSTWALLKTLETIRERLYKIQQGSLDLQSELQSFGDIDEDEIVSEILDELAESSSSIVDFQDIDHKKLEEEINSLNKFIDMAKSITVDAKSEALLDALEIGFKDMIKRGANKKALIFTESKRTQEYLKSFLESHGYKGKIVIFNGTNSGPEINAIYKEWLVKNRYNGRISGAPTADKRNAIIEYFRDEAEILIATESAAEGVNLQFCSLVVNYDLPWNPQRIEQRIGRCHRYGQKSDVVVINFLNRRNYADLRVHELLDQKFNLFNGVFGSSDEVLGSIESGVDFEQRILEIYQKCRTQEEIDLEFNLLQEELEEKISKTMQQTKEKLFENFDSEVHERLKMSVAEYLDKYARYFWSMTKFILNEQAVFEEENKRFKLSGISSIFSAGTYSMISKEHSNNDCDYLYRMNHPLGQYVLEEALNLNIPSAKIIFDITNHKGYKLSQVEQLKGESGYLTLHKFTINSLDNEEHLLFSGFTSNGSRISSEQCRNLFECDGFVEKIGTHISDYQLNQMNVELERYKSGKLEESNLKNMVYIREEEERLNKWTEDMVYALEKELNLIKSQIRDTEKNLRLSTTTEQHLELQEKLQALNKKKRKVRYTLEENEEQIIEKRDSLINDIRRRMQLETQNNEIFTVQWEVI